MQLNRSPAVYEVIVKNNSKDEEKSLNHETHFNESLNQMNHYNYIAPITPIHYLNKLEYGDMLIS